MVTRGYYDDGEPHSFRRYSSRGHSYALSHDRNLPSAPLQMSYDNHRTHHSTGQESRTGASSPEQDSNSRPRSRIPVACGRCRKRKIRCSGDNGGPCSNCKSAGNEQCQFLRVSSTEAQMKSDGSASDFNYDPTVVATRLQCRMIPQGPQYALPHAPSMAYDPYQFRNHSLSTYQYPAKSLYAMPTFPEYPEENVDYGLQGSTFQLIGPEHIAVPSNPSYGASVPGRGWNSTPQVSKSASLFLEQEAVYNHGQLPYSSATFPLRQMTNSEIKGIGLSRIPTLPAIAGTDRVLPDPATNRSAQVGSFLRNVDSLSTNTQSGYQSYGALMTPNMLSSVKIINNSVVSDNAGYLPLSSSTPESLTSQLTFGGTDSSGGMNPHHNELYTPHEGLYNTSEPSDSSYGPSSGGSKRGSHSSQTTNTEDLSPCLPEGSLSNGHAYIPYNSSSPMPYPPPRMDIPPPPVTHRRTSVKAVGLTSS